MAQTVPLPLQSRRCHDLLNSPSRVNVEDQAGLHPIRREPFPQIVVHLDLAFASGLSYGRWHNDVAALEVNRFPQKALVQFCAAHSAESNQRKVWEEIRGSRIQ